MKIQTRDMCEDITCGRGVSTAQIDWLPSSGTEVHTERDRESVIPSDEGNKKSDPQSQDLEAQ